MSDKYLKIKFPTNLVRRAESVFSSRPFLNVNSYWVGVNALCVERSLYDKVKLCLERDNFPLDSVSVSDFKR